MAFGIDPAPVFANDGAANPAFWTLLPGGTHGKIVAALKADTAVQVALQAKFNAPNNIPDRDFVIDHINRATANCIGQAIFGQSLQPEKGELTLYNLLATGTAAQIDTVIGSSPDLHTAFAAKNADQVIATISRETGRALLQTCVDQIITTSKSPTDVLKKVISELKAAVGGVLPGLQVDPILALLLGL